MTRPKISPKTRGKVSSNCSRSSTGHLCSEMEKKNSEFQSKSSYQNKIEMELRRSLKESWKRCGRVCFFFPTRNNTFSQNPKT
jgi:hypothetical protein